MLGGGGGGGSMTPVAHAEMSASTGGAALDGQVKKWILSMHHPRKHCRWPLVDRQHCRLPVECHQLIIGLQFTNRAAPWQQNR